MRILSHMLTLFVQIKNWLSGENSVSTTYTRSHSSSSSTGGGKALSIPKRLRNLKKYYSTNVADVYITTIIAGWMTLSAGFALSFYRLCVSPLCFYILSPDCYNFTGHQLEREHAEGYPINYVDKSAPRSTSVINFSVNIFMLLLGLYMGYILSNYYGRRRAMIISSVPSLLGWSLLLAYADTQHQMLFFGAQALNSLGAGIVILSSVVYLVEICHRKDLMYVSCCISCPMVLGLLLGWIVHLHFTPTVVYIHDKYAADMQNSHISGSIQFVPYSVGHWLVFAITGLAMAISNIMATYFLPESPYWLVHTGNIEKASVSLAMLNSVYEDNDKGLDEIQRVELSTDVPSSPRVSLRHCLGNRFYSFIYACSLVILQQVGGANLVISFIPSLHSYAFGHEENSITLTGSLSCLILLISWLLCKFYSHRVYLIAATVLATLSCICYTAFLGLNLNEFYINRHAIYIVWPYIFSIGLSAAQLLPVVQFIATLPNSLLRSKSCCVLFSLAIVVFYFMSFLRLYITSYELFAIFAVANTILLTVLVLFS